MITSSPHFSEDELCCKCCGRFPRQGMSVELLNGLELLRKRIGNRPVHVTCGYRCENHNAEVGGKVDSQHLFGTAADIWVDDMDVEELAFICENIFDSVGKYTESEFVHVDQRRDGNMRGEFVWDGD